MTNTFGYNPRSELTSAVRETTASSTNSYVYGLDLSGTPQGAGTIGGILCASLNGSTAFYAYDGNGNVTDLVGTNGSFAAKYQYDPYGNTIAKSGDLADVNPFRFSTKYTDSESGLLYYGYRQYSPELGRFVNRDPLGDYVLLSQHVTGRSRRDRQLLFNLSLRPLYPFVDNDPVNSVDPFGLYGGNCPDLQEKCACLFACGKSKCEQGASLANQALQEAQKRYPGSLHNGKGDAWRHCYWSCQMARALGQDCAKKIGDNHEACGDRHGQPADEHSMDEHNNQKGRDLATKKGNCGDLCEDALNNGDLKVLTP